MRRYLIATAAVAALLAAAPAGAAPRSTQAKLSDAGGDWPVASQDIVSAQFSSSRASGTPVLRAVLTLATAPDEVADYAVWVGSGCDSWSLATRRGAARLQRTSCDQTELPEVAPATMTVSGKQIVITAPYALGLGRGMLFDSMTVTAAPYLTGVAFGSSVGPSAFVLTGDYAGRTVDLVLA